MKRINWHWVLLAALVFVLSTAVLDGLTGNTDRAFWKALWVSAAANADRLNIEHTRLLRALRPVVDLAARIAGGKS